MNRDPEFGKDAILGDLSELKVGHSKCRDISWDLV